MSRIAPARRTAFAVLAAALVASIHCGGSDAPAVPPVMSMNAGDGQSASYGTAVPIAPSVKLTNESGTGVAGVTVTFAVVSGGGVVTGATKTTGSDGIAAVGSWILGANLGPNAMTATASNNATGGPITFTATATAGPASIITLNAGNGQTAAAGAAVATPPSVKVTDAAGNVVTGTTVTFAVASGGGSVTGGSQTTNSSGIATVGAWTLGTAGANSLTATATGLTGSPITFTATATAVSGGSLPLSAVSPALLTPGISATITGTGFSTTPASNTVTIDGTAATVTAATATQLTVTVPTTIPCNATHDGTISVTVGANNGTITKPLQVATQRTLAVGQSLIITDPTQIRCNELTTSTSAHYFIDVYNTNTTYSTTGAQFQVRGASGTGASGASPQLSGAVPLMSVQPSDAMKFAVARHGTMQVDPAEAAHLRVLENNIRIFTEHRGEAANQARRANRNTAVAPLPTVGQIIAIRVPNANVTNCTTFFPINAKVIYVGTRSIVLEDVNNPVKDIDSTYTAIAQEFDSKMYGILTANFGDPLAYDASTDANQHEFMVFTNQINLNMNALAGFVDSCDLFPTNTSNNTVSNFGEYFYARVPTAPGTYSTTDSPPRWRWTMRATIIHESKHLASFAEKLSRAGGSAVAEQSWLEETTARISEELYDRDAEGLAQKANTLYGSAANPVGPWCGVRGASINPPVAACLGKPRGIVRVFEELASAPSTGNPTAPYGWYTAPEDHSPLGRVDQSDFSFYSTGWSLVRWAIDQTSALSESAFLKALVQETSKSGVANLEARTGRPFADMEPEWTLAMAVDDYPSFTPALATLKQPSWNFRDVFAGLKTDFPSYYTAYSGNWPLVPFSRTYGTFTVDYHALPGTASFIELSGTQSAKQLIELKAAGASTAAAPAELRIAIVRVP